MRCRHAVEHMTLHFAEYVSITPEKPDFAGLFNGEYSLSDGAHLWRQFAVIQPRFWAW